MAASVRYVDLEGGFWGLEATTGELYELQHEMPEEFQKDGMKVEVKLELTQEASFRMWGQTALIIEIRALNLSPAKS